MAVDRDLLAILACPRCKEAVTEEGAWLVCAACRLRYPVRDEIPVMLEEEAESFGEGSEGPRAS